MAILNSFSYTLFALALTFTKAYPQSSPNQGVIVPSAPPGNVGPEVSPNFPAFAFETAAFVRYAQYDDGSPNTFSQNLIQSVVSRTGGIPIIRLGGTSGDFAPYVPSQQEPALPRDENDRYQDVGGTSIGPSYFPLAKNFPDAQYILQVPLGLNNISNAVAWARAGVEGIGLDHIVSIEIGNEPDLYTGNPPGQPRLGLQQYLDSFLEHEEAIVDNITNLTPGPFFQAIDASSGREDVYPVDDTFTAGINRNNRIKTVGQHYYQTTATPQSDLQQDLLNHGALTSRLDSYKPYIEFLAQNNPDIPLILSEIGNSLNTKNIYSFQGVLGSALWQVDLQLYSMAIGIKAAHFQQIMHSGFDLWLPVDSAGLRAEVFPPYYAQPFAADFIGRSGGRTCVSNLQTGFPNVPGYAAYEGDQLARLAFVNLNVWDGSNGIRPVRNIPLELPEAVTSIRLDFLSSPNGAHARDGSITYAGSQWTRESEGNEVRDVRRDSRTLPVNGGRVTVRVPASSAVLVHVSNERRRLGLRRPGLRSDE
ncbi:MAG: hypothetical protein M1831_006914 [Alyxoria varia]|nr:MAG: hypothetical protein M1831_006914 [Alyxoria varia]